MIIFFIMSGCIRKKDFNDNLNSLVKTELAFAKKSKETGIREAFLTFLSDDAIVFHPEPIKGKPLYAEKPDTPGLLIWKPIFADVSIAGDLGYTTGPFEFRKDAKKKEPDGYGHYVTVWKRQNDGKWRVVIDAGIHHSVVERHPKEMVLSQSYKRNSHKYWKKVDIEKEHEKLLTQDRKFSKSSLLEGFKTAFEVYIADDVRYYRMDEFPIIGKEAVLVKLEEKNGLLTWEPMAAEMSISGDLGYTYGISEVKTGESGSVVNRRGSYLRIWKKQSDGEWKVVLDMANPIPSDSDKAHN